MAKAARMRRSGCPISIALEMFGDAWSLVVVRDLMFKGCDTFHDLSCGDEGIATNILTDRLARLEECGLIEKERDAEDARRFIYRLTPKGMDLAPVMIELILWAAKHERTDAPPALLRQMRNDRADFIARLREQWSERRRRKD
jgi:DNA-binding HxlR family transcriptional regulator